MLVVAAMFCMEVVGLRHVVQPILHVALLHLMWPCLVSITQPVVDVWPAAEGIDSACRLQQRQLSCNRVGFSWHDHVDIMPQHMRADRCAGAAACPTGDWHPSVHGS